MKPNDKPMENGRTTMENGNGAGTPTTAELVSRLGDQTSRLAHLEVELAKAELEAKAKRAGLGAGMFGGAGAFGFYAVGALTAAAILGLSHAVTGWLAALIVAAALAALAGISALLGARTVAQATPPLPEQAAESVREDVESTREHARAGRA